MEEQIVPGKFEVFMNWLKSVWEKIDIKKWSEDIGGSSAQAIEGAIYFGIGFAFGFLFKKYFKFVFFTILTAMAVILILEYNKILTIDWLALNVFLGFDPASDFGVILNSIFDWIKTNLIKFIAGLVGFLVGYKLG